MKRLAQWATLIIAGWTLLMVAVVFVWVNSENIIAIVIMVCLLVIIFRQAQDLGILE